MATTRPIGEDFLESEAIRDAAIKGEIEAITQAYEAWKNSEAYVFLEHSGLTYNGAMVNSLARAYRFGQFDGSLKQLEEIAVRSRRIRNFGPKGSARVCKAFFAWYHQRLEACDTASGV